MKRSFYISLQTSCNEMLFCGIFISILNHINDSLSWRIRWKKKKSKTQQTNLLLLVLLPGGFASETAEHPLQPWWVRASPMESGIWGAPSLRGPSHSTANIPRHMMGSDHLKQLQTPETANSSKQAAKKPT